MSAKLTPYVNESVHGIVLQTLPNRSQEICDFIVVVDAVDQLPLGSYNRDNASRRKASSCSRRGVDFDNLTAAKKSLKGVDPCTRRWIRIFLGESSLKIETTVRPFSLYSAPGECFSYDRRPQSSVVPFFPDNQGGKTGGQTTRQDPAFLFFFLVIRHHSEADSIS